MLSEQIDHFMKSEMARLFTAVPSAGHLTEDNQTLDKNYYLRHRIETIKRIWMTSKTDALALAAMVDEDYEAARFWSKYLQQELNHDLLFLKDLEKHNITHTQVANTPCFESTISMVEYLKTCIDKYGSIAAVAYSVWVEWNSDKASSIVVKKVQKQFGNSFSKGAHAHVMIDVNEDHYEVMLKITESLMAKQGDETILFMILKQLTDFFIGYFAELQEEVDMAVSN